MLKINDILNDANYSLSAEDEKKLADRLIESDRAATRPYRKEPIIPLLAPKNKHRIFNFDNSGDQKIVPKGYCLLRIPHAEAATRYYLINLENKPLGAGSEAEVLLSPLYFTREEDSIKLHHVNSAIKRIRLSQASDKENEESDHEFELKSDHESDLESEDVSFEEESQEEMTLEELLSRATTEAAITKQRYRSTSPVVVDEAEKCVYFATKYHPGKDSGKAKIQVNRTWLSINLCAQLLRLHHDKIRHLDIKPENIMFHNDVEKNRIRLRFIDFSGSRHELIINPHEIYSDHYLAPELLRDDKNEPTYQSDLYSLACVLNYCCRDPRETFRFIDEGPRKGGTTINLVDFPTKEVGKTILKTIQMMSHNDPTKRLPLKQAMAQLLKDFKGEHESDVTVAFKSELSNWLSRNDESDWPLHQRIIKLLGYHPDVWDDKHSQANALMQDVKAAISPADHLDQLSDATDPMPSKGRK